MSKDLNRLFKDSLIYGSGRYIQQVVGFLLIPLYTRCLQPADYGIMDTISVFQATLGIVFVLGLDSAFARFYLDAENGERRRAITSTVFFFRLLIVLVFSVVIYFSAGWLSGRFYGDTAHSPVFRVVSALVVGNLLYGFCLEALRFNMMPVRYAVTSVTVTICTILLTVYLIVILKTGVIGIFIAQAAVLFAVGFPLAFWKIKNTFGAVFSASLLRELLRYGLPLVPAAVSYWVMTHSNRYFLLRFSSLDAIGLYAVGEKFVRILVLVITGFQLAWGPFAFSMYKKDGAKKVFSDVLTLYVVVMGLLAVSISLFTPEVVRLMTRPAYYRAAEIIPFLIFTPVAMGMYYIVSVGVSIMKKTKHIGWTTGVAAAVNVGLNVLLIPRWGICGAASATTVSYLLSAILLYRVAQRVYPIPYRMGKVSVVFLLAVGAVAGGRLLLPGGLSAGGVLIKLGILLGMALVIVLAGIVPLTRLKFLKAEFAGGSD